ncbi:hypothetical protein HZY95_00565, partial [Staphylococcus sciuri]
MKKITKITIFLIFCIITFIFLNFYNYIDDIKLPGYNKALVIEKWDKKHNKEEINRLLVKLSTEHNISMIRVNGDYDDNGKTKYLSQYNLNEKLNFNEKAFNRNKKYQIIKPDNKILGKLNLVGTTFFIKENPKSDFYETLEEKGLTTKDYEFPLHLIILEYISTHQLPSTFIILLVIIFIAILYDQLASVKEMSIKRIHGFTSAKIIALQLLKITKIFVSHFIIITLI